MPRSTAVLHTITSYKRSFKRKCCLHQFFQLSHTCECFKYCRYKILVLNQLFHKTLQCSSLLWRVRNSKGGTREKGSRCLQTVATVLLIGTLAKQCHICHWFLLSTRNTSRKIYNGNLIFFPQLTAVLQEAASLVLQNGYCLEVFTDKIYFLGPLTLGHKH